jgi:hypothetical protein
MSIVAAFSVEYIFNAAEGCIDVVITNTHNNINKCTHNLNFDDDHLNPCCMVVGDTIIIKYRILYNNIVKTAGCCEATSQHVEIPPSLLSLVLNRSVKVVNMTFHTDRSIMSLA